MFGYVDPTGLVRTYNINGAIDFGGPVLQSLGTTAIVRLVHHRRRLTITPAHVQARFEATNGEDPIFRSNDGSKPPAATCPARS